MVADLIYNILFLTLSVCHLETRGFLFGIPLGYYVWQHFLQFHEEQGAYGWHDAEGLRACQVKCRVARSVWIFLDLYTAHSICSIPLP